VNNSKVHAVLSELHRLLSLYTPSEFASAGDYEGVPESLRAALRSLAQEAGRPGTDSQGNIHRADKSRKGVGRRRRLALESSFPTNEILNSIRKSSRYTNSRGIMQIAKDLGISLQAKPKDGKDRLARRLAQAIQLTGEPRRSELLALLDREAKSQTEGWIGVIKSTRQ